MATARTVSTLLKNQLQPVLIETGFEVDGRTSVMRAGPITAVFNVASLSKAMSGHTDLPTASFTATLGLDYLSAAPSGFAADLEPHVPDIGETQLLALLSVTSEVSDRIDRPDVWPVRDKPGAEAAVDDLVRAVRQQAIPLLDQWFDLDRTYDLLRDTKVSDHPGAVDQPEIRLPGSPESINRLSHLAVLAALRGAVDDEVQALGKLLELTPDPMYQRRLQALT